MKKKVIVAVSVLLVALLFTGAIFYYNFEIANPNRQPSKHKVIATANLATALNVTEIPRNSPFNVPSPLPYNYLYITGSVSNTGESTAYNAGLHVAAYAADGTLEINMTSSD